jgi:hypothetical protein
MHHEWINHSSHCSGYYWWNPHWRSYIPICEADWDIIIILSLLLFLVVIVIIAIIIIIISVSIIMLLLSLLFHTLQSPWN